MATLGSAVLELTTDSDKLKTGLQGAGESARAWGSKMISAGGDISNGLRPVTNIIDNVLRSSVSMASGTEEALSKVRIVFGDSAGDIEAFAAGAAKSLGMSTLAALDATGTLGNLFKGMGLGADATRDMSTGVVTLAADLGSFNNVPTAEVLDAIRSGLVGQAEPMRRFGVLLSEGAVAAEGQRLGLSGVGDELTEQEKVQARYSLILAGTVTAQGDFARTSDGLANSLKTQKAEQENVQAQLGVALIPTMKAMTELVTGLMGAFAGLSPQLQTAVMIGGALLLVLGPLLTVIGVVTSALGFAAGALGIVSVVGGVTTITIGSLSFALAALALPLLLIIATVALLAVAWSNNWGDIQGKFTAVTTVIQNVTDAMREALLTTWRAILIGVSFAVNTIIGVVNTLIDGYNALASRLGLPLLGKIDVITPNLDAVDNAIDSVAAKRRVAMIYAQMVGGAGGGGSGGVGGPMIGFASGTDHVTRGPEVFVAGEAGPERVQVTPLGGASGSGAGGAAGHSHPIVMDGALVAAAVGARHVRGAESMGLPLVTS